MDHNTKKEYLDNAKEKLSNVYKHSYVSFGKTHRGDDYVQVHYIPKTRPQSQQEQWVKVFYDNETELNAIEEELKIKLK